MKNTDYYFNPDTGFTRIRQLTPEGRWIEGTAQVHPDDKHKQTEFRGGVIADFRLSINLHKDAIRTCKSIIKTLKQLLACMEQNRQFNPRGYESGLIKAEICRRMEEIEVHGDCIAILREELNDYLNALDNWAK